MCHLERINWRATVVIDLAVSTQQVECCWPTGCSALFGGCARSCAGGPFNFELADFGTNNCSSVGVSRVDKKFDMVVGDLKMSSLAGGEAAGAE